jgi:DNA replication and repair protein RecF
MRITHLGITNFKNYARLELDLTPGTTVVYGENAQGKTSFLEAIYYLAGGRSLGAQTDTQLINWVAQQSGLAYARLVAQVQRELPPRGPGKLDQFEIVLSLEASRGSSEDFHAGEGPVLRLRKGLKYNGATTRALDWIGKLTVVLFVPADLELVTGPPAQRRSYLDNIISQIDPRYAEALSTYTRVVQQRNQHLKQLQERGAGSSPFGPSRERPPSATPKVIAPRTAAPAAGSREPAGGSPDSVHMWDDQLVSHGTYLVLRRQSIMTSLDERVQSIHPELTGGRERLRLLYRPNLDIGRKVDYQLPLALGADFSATYHQPNLDAGDVAAHFYARLREGEARELAQGVTLAGPHRDEMRFLVDGVDMNIYGSRGQQRSTALALKLAEMELMHGQTGEQPILLLDDVLSELDAKRRRYLISRVDAHEQTLVTTTDLEEYGGQFTRPVRALHVHEGIVRRDEAGEALLLAHE